jgi:tRNA dimethylallyltransferase
VTDKPTNPAVLIIAGPTGSGKSALALALARVLGGVIINADSMQLYRELRILTARPTPADEATVPHRLYGVLDAADACSVGRWLDLALAELAACRTRHQLAIVVGGTGLYLKALTEGLSRLPAIPPEIRRETRRLFDDVGEAAFRAMLAERDPLAARRRLDRQRLLRAFEVVTATGQSLATWHERHPPVPPLDQRVGRLILMPPRPALYATLDRRFDAMIQAGALNEVRALIALGLDPGLPAMKALGVRDLASHLQGDVPLPTAIDAAKQATRRYAKRQMTWFRHQMPGATVINEQYSERNRDAVCTFIRQRLLTCRG